METTPCVRELTVDEIQWDLTPLPEPPPMTATDQVVEATVDALSYRLLAFEAIDQLRELTLRLERERESYIRILQECGRLRQENQRLQEQHA
jgi:hypothetical protein